MFVYQIWNKNPKPKNMLLTILKHQINRKFITHEKDFALLYKELRLLLSKKRNTRPLICICLTVRLTHLICDKGPHIIYSSSWQRWSWQVRRNRWRSHPDKGGCSGGQHVHREQSVPCTSELGLLSHSSLARSSPAVLLTACSNTSTFCIRVRWS